MEKIFNLRKYIIYGLLGICMEIFWTGLGSLIQNDYTMEGRTYIWMFFIYGSAIFLEPIHDRLRDYNFVVRGFIYMFLIYGVEFISGLLIQTIIGECPWYYTDAGSIGGIITLFFIPVWFSLGLILERVHDFLNTIDWISEENYDRHLE
jgi:hypothetical protein